jgi:hypothetical protein
MHPLGLRVSTRRINTSTNPPTSVNISAAALRPRCRSGSADRVGVSPALRRNLGPYEHRHSRTMDNATKLLFVPFTRSGPVAADRCQERDVR